MSVSTAELAAAVHGTERQNAENGFRASSELRDDLQSVLVDLIALGIQGKQVHWAIVGPNFRDLHQQLDEIVAAARSFGDDVAERMRALHAMPDGRAQTVASMTALALLPAGEILTTDAVNVVTDRLDQVSATVREVHDRVDEEDPTTADLLHAILDRIEQLSWMVSAENREPE